MKKLLTYLIISASVFILVSCDKPAPTQLIDDTTDEFEVELLNKDLEGEYYSSGADTSGITQDLKGITNLISVSGIKISTEKGINHISLAQAIFFDKNQPIYVGGKLLAYKSIIRGTIKFNGTEANKVPYRIRFREGGIQKDTLLGFKYALYNVGNGDPDPFYFGYDASVSFEFDPILPGGNISFNILTPHEINGSVSLSGSKMSRNLEATLNWNGRGGKRVFVIIGLLRPGQLQSVPVYKMKTPDDGELKIPGRYLNQLPLDRFEKIVFTFIRSYESYHGNGNNELLVSSQSIHSIVIDIP